MSRRSEFSREERLFWERQDRALAMLDRPIVQHIFSALDTLGWKIVPQDGSNQSFPAHYWHKPTARWPSWCERKKPSPKLRLIDGGKPDDDGRA